MKIPVVVALAVLTSPVAAAPNLTLQRTFVVNGNVNAAITDGSSLYIGGTFNYIGQRSGELVRVDATTGLNDKSIPEIAGGGVFSIISDGHGGYFLGGDFRSVGTLRLRALAHLNADRTFDSKLAPSFDGIVTALAHDATTLYVGGDFLHVNGMSRTYFAAFDIATGALLPQSFALDNQIRTMSLDGSMLFLGGDFSAVNGQPRSHLARIDVPSFTLSAWNPGANDDVMALLATGSTVYTAGQFTQLGTRARNHVGSIDATTGAVRGFDPNTGGTVWSIARQSGMLYLGGDLGTVGGQPRSNVAAVDASTGAVLPFDAHVHAGIGLIRSLVATPDALYIGGSFIDTIGGEPRMHAGAVDPTTGALLPWDLHPGDDVYAFAVDPKGIIVGGVFTSVNGQDRVNLAAIDLTTGRATNWKPKTTLDPTQGHVVNALAIAGSTIYIGGIFAAVNGQPRANFAAVSTAGAVLPIRADANRQVRSLATSGSTAYIGGDFTTIAGTSRNHLAAVNSTGTLLPWNPNANDTIQSLVVAGSSIYAAGVFSTIGGLSRRGFVGLDPTTGAPGPDFQADSFSHALAYDGVTLYIGGQFTTFGGQPRTDLAAIIPGTTTPTSFAPVEPPASQVDTLGVTSSAVYASVSYAPGSTMLFDKTTGAPITPNTALPTPFFTFVRVPNGIAFGGTFASVGTSPQSGIAVFTGTP